MVNYLNEMQARVALACTRGSRQMGLIHEIIENGYAPVKNTRYGSHFGEAELTDASMTSLTNRLESNGFDVRINWDAGVVSLRFVG